MQPLYSLLSPGRRCRCRRRRQVAVWEDGGAVEVREVEGSGDAAAAVARRRVSCRGGGTAKVLRFDPLVVERDLSVEGPVHFDMVVALALSRLLYAAVSGLLSCGFLTASGKGECAQPPKEMGQKRVAKISLCDLSIRVKGTSTMSNKNMMRRVEGRS